MKKIPDKKYIPMSARNHWDKKVKFVETPDDKKQVKNRTVSASASSDLLPLIAAITMSNI